MSEKKEQNSVGTVIADTITNKYFVITLLILLAVLICSFIATGDMLTAVFTDLWESLFASACISAALLSVNITLVRSGISRKTINDSLRSVDPKLTGFITDFSGIGSLLSALAAVVYALSRMYMSDSSLYSGDFIISVVLIIARALMLGCSLGLLTSRDELYQMLFLTVSRMSGARGEELVKNVSKTSHSPKIMGALRRNLFIDISVQTGVSLVCMISALTASVLPFPVSAAGLLFPIITIISAGVPSGDSMEIKDEMEKLGAGGYSFCIINTVMYVVIICMMLFSFPFRSVYTNYVAKSDFAYYDEVLPTIKVFSVPEISDETMPMFIGIFTVTVLFIVVESLASSTYDTATFLLKASLRGLASQGAVLLIMLCYCILYSVIVPQSTMNAVMWLVSVSISCLMLGINLIHILVMSARNRTNNQRNGE